MVKLNGIKYVFGLYVTENVCVSVCLCGSNVRITTFKYGYIYMVACIRSAFNARNHEFIRELVSVYVFNILFMFYPKTIHNKCIILFNCVLHLDYL